MLLELAAELRLGEPRSAGGHDERHPRVIHVTPGGRVSGGLFDFGVDLGRAFAGVDRGLRLGLEVGGPRGDRGLEVVVEVPRGAGVAPDLLALLDGGGGGEFRGVVGAGRFDRGHSPGVAVGYCVGSRLGR